MEHGGETARLQPFFVCFWASCACRERGSSRAAGGRGAKQPGQSSPSYFRIWFVLSVSFYGNLRSPGVSSPGGEGTAAPAPHLPKKGKREMETNSFEI